MHRLIFLSCFILALGCQQSGTFQDFARSVPELPTPLRLQCGFNGPQLEFHLDSTLYRRYSPYPEGGFGSYLAGKLPQVGEVTPLLYFTVGDLLYPNLFTYDKHGRIVDTLYLHFSACEAGPWGWRSDLTFIDSTSGITMIDTAVSYRVDESGEGIAGTDSLRIALRRVRIRLDGHFEQVYDTSWYAGKDTRPY